MTAYLDRCRCQQLDLDRKKVRLSNDQFDGDNRRERHVYVNGSKESAMAYVLPIEMRK
jgi:hypothetical protein